MLIEILLIHADKAESYSQARDKAHHRQVHDQLKPQATREFFQQNNSDYPDSNHDLHLIQCPILKLFLRLRDMALTLFLYFDEIFSHILPCIIQSNKKRCANTIAFKLFDNIF